MGFLQTHTHSQPRRIVQTKDDVIIIYEANQGLRQILTDGRSLPEDPNPQWEGYSVGRWDGDTLVVESNGFRDEGWLDVNGSPFTSALRLTERYRRVNYGRMEIDLTINDPKAYMQPFTIRVNWRLEPEQQLIEFICHENNLSKEHYDAQPGRGACVANQVDHGLEGAQRTPAPVLRDVAEQPMLDLVPLARARREVADVDAQAGVVGQLAAARPSTGATDSRCCRRRPR